MIGESVHIDCRLFNESQNRVYCLRVSLTARSKYAIHQKGGLFTSPRVHSVIESREIFTVLEVRSLIFLKTKLIYDCTLKPFEMASYTSATYHRSIVIPVRTPSFVDCNIIQVECIAAS